MDNCLFVLIFCSLYSWIGGNIEPGRSCSGDFQREPSSVCHYLQCVHSQTLTRRCPAGLGVQPHFTHGHKNPCVVHYNHCSYPEDVQSVSQPLGPYSQQAPVRTADAAEVERRTPGDRKYLKQLLPHGYPEPLYGGPTEQSHTHQHGMAHATQGLPQYNNFQMPQNNYESTFHQFLNTLTDPTASGPVSAPYPDSSGPTHQHNNVYNAHSFNTEDSMPPYPDTVNRQPFYPIYETPNSQVPNGHIGSQQQYPSSGFHGRFPEGNKHSLHQPPAAPTHLPPYQPPTYPTQTFSNNYLVDGLQHSSINPAQYVPDTGIVISLPTEHLHNPQSSSASHNIAGTYVLPESNANQNNAGAYALPESNAPHNSAGNYVLPKVNVLQNTADTYVFPQPAVQSQQSPSQGAAYARQPTQSTSTSQKQNALTKLIPFILNLSNKRYQVNQPSQSTLRQKRILLAKILLKLIEAIKAGSVKSPGVNPGAQKSLGLNQSTRRRPLLLSDRRPGGRFKHRGQRQRRRRRKYKIMGKMAEGQSQVGSHNIGEGETQGRAHNVDDIHNSDYTDYTSDIEDEDPYKTTQEEDIEQGQAAQAEDLSQAAPNTAGIDYSSPGTDAPATHESKFRHMRDGIRIPKQGRLTDSHASQDPIHSSEASEHRLQGTPDYVQTLNEDKGQLSRTNEVQYTSTSSRFKVDGLAENKFGDFNFVKNVGHKDIQVDIMESLDSFDKSLFDDVPLEYLEQLKSLARDYFNEEYDNAVPAQGMGSFIDYEHLKKDYSGGSQTDFQLMPGVHEITGSELEDMSTIPPMQGESQQQGGLLKRLTNSEKVLTQSVATEQLADTVKSSASVSVKPDMTIEQALTYYTQLLQNLSELIEQASPDKVTGIEQASKHGAKEDKPASINSQQDFTETLKNYSYQDVLSAVNEQEYQSNSLTS